MLGRKAGCEGVRTDFSDGRALSRHRDIGPARFKPVDCEEAQWASDTHTAVRAVPVVRGSVHISFREERNPRIGETSKERKQLALHASLPDF